MIRTINDNKKQPKKHKAIFGSKNKQKKYQPYLALKQHKRQLKVTMWNPWFHLYIPSKKKKNPRYSKIYFEDAN